MLISAVLVLLLSSALSDAGVARFSKESLGYEDVAVVLDSGLPRDECPQIIDSIKTALTSASRSLYIALDGRGRLASVNIQVPRGWSAADCQTPVEENDTFRTKDADIVVSVDHPLHKDVPWTQQSQGCGKQGHFVYLSRAFLEAERSRNGTNSSKALGDAVRNQWIRYRFGVFADFDHDQDDGEGVQDVTSQQYALCHGKSVSKVIEEHRDMLAANSATTAAAKPTGRSAVPPSPRFAITSQPAPKIVIVLENSQAMNAHGHWDVISLAVKKWVLHDLPADVHLGLVLFNEGAHLAHPVAELVTTRVREGVDVHIANRFNLNPSNKSCPVCGLMKAVEALSSTSSSPSVGGASVVLISQGVSNKLAINEEADLKDQAEKHRLRFYSVSVPGPNSLNDLCVSLERLSFDTGGLSFFVTQHDASAANVNGLDLNVYSDLVDAFREIQARTTDDGPFLVYEKTFLPHSGKTPLEDTGSFVVDKYVGRDTELDVFARNHDNGFLKSIVVQDKRGQQYKNIHSRMAQFHILTAYGVPFELSENIGMNWTYSLERMPSPRKDNGHVVRVSSKPRTKGECLTVTFFTSSDFHLVTVSASNPLKLFAEVKLNGLPVMEARVTAFLRSIGQNGNRHAKAIRVDLLDSGNRDPDMQRNDGVYSRYLTDFSGGEGRYDVTLLVDDNQGQAFSFQHAQVSSRDDRSCCKDLSFRSEVRNQKLGSFSRLVRGDSFRVSVLATPTSATPPARILDLQADVRPAQHEIEFTWTAPGEDFDRGKPTSYQLFSSENGFMLYSNLNLTRMVDGFSAMKNAGETEKHSVRVDVFDKNVFYAIVAVDKDGNVAQVSNVKEVLMPSPKLVTSSSSSLNSVGSSSDSPEQRFIPRGMEQRALLYIIVGIFVFVVLCGLVVVAIIVSYRRKKMSASQTDLSETMQSVGVNALGHDDDDDGSPGYAVCDDTDVYKEHHETNRFLINDPIYGDLNHMPANQSNGGMVTFADGGGDASSVTYGWTTLNNPYVTGGGRLPIYSDFAASNSYVPNYVDQPTYAQPLPRSQRQGHFTPTSALLQSVVQHSTPQSPSGSSSSGQSSVAFRRSLLTSHPANSNGSSVEDRISPPLEVSASASNTPTKSILKKPKNYGAGGATASSTAEDTGSSASSTATPRDDAGTPTETGAAVATAQHKTVEAEPDFSPSNTFLETSFEAGDASGGVSRLAPPTLPKPFVRDAVEAAAVDRRVRSITQV